MVIRKGSTRIVFVFSRIVIKIPRMISFYKRASKNFSFYGHYSVKNILKTFMAFLKMFLVPIYDNWSELVFYKKYTPNICSPTFFSFLGLFNIQLSTKSLSDSDEYIYEYKVEFDANMIQAFSKREIDYYVDPHTFSDPGNFGFIGNKFVCFDYADTFAQKNILDFGDKIQKAFKDFDKKTKPLE